MVHNIIWLLPCCSFIGDYEQGARCTSNVAMFYLILHVVS